MGDFPPAALTGSRSHIVFENMIYKLVFVLASLYAITASPIVPEDSMVEVFTEMQTEAALNMELLTEVTKHPVHVQYQAFGLLKMAHAQNGGEPSPTDELELWEDDADFSQQGENWKWAKKTFKRAKRTVRRTYRRAKRTVRRTYRRVKRTARRHYRRAKRTVRRSEEGWPYHRRSPEEDGRKALPQSHRDGWRSPCRQAIRSRSQGLCEALWQVRSLARRCWWCKSSLCHGRSHCCNWLWCCLPLGS